MAASMNLDNFVIPENISINYIQKKYYDKYFYKLILNIDQAKLIKDNQKAYRFNYIVYTNRFALVNNLVKDIKASIVDDDYRFRSENISVSVFTNSEANIIKLITDLPDRVVALYRPLNTAHIDLVENHKKVLVRNSLFEKQYKFKVYLKPSWAEREARFSEVKEWLTESNLDYGINGALNKYFYTNKSMRGLGFTVAVYFNNPQDLMMFQLRFNEKILKIEEAVLLSEL
jgi:hypothetical protein